MEQQQQIDNKNAWIPHPKLPNGVFDNVKPFLCTTSYSTSSSLVSS